METFTQKKEKRYRYFACEKDMKRINSICPLKRVPAAELKNLLLREIVGNSWGRKQKSQSD